MIKYNKRDCSNSKNPHLGVWGLLFSFFGLSAQPVFTLPQCVKTGIENNLSLKQSQLVQESAQASLFQSKMALLPSLNAFAGQSWGFGRSLDPVNYRFVNSEIETNNFSINSNLTLFNGFKQINSVRMNESKSLQSKTDVEQAKQQLTMEIVQAYAQVLYNQSVVEAAENQENSTALQVAKTSKMLQAGTLSPSKLYDLEARLASDRLLVIEYTNQLRLSRLVLMQLLNISPVPDSFKLEPIENQAYEPVENEPTAFTGHFSVQSARYQLQYAERNLSASRGGFTPRLSMSAGINTLYSDAQIKPTTGKPYGFSEQLNNNLYQSVSLNLSIPLFNQWFSHSQVQQAAIQRKNAAIQLDISKQKLQKLSQSAQQEWQAAQMKKQATQQQLKAAEQAYQSVQSRFNAGMADGTEYYVSSGLYFKARSEHLQADYDLTLKTILYQYYKTGRFNF